MRQGPVGQILDNLASVPLGAGTGDPVIGSPQNVDGSADYVKCFVRNMSGNLAREYEAEAISQYRGGELTAAAAKKKGEDFDLDYRKKLVAQGQNGSVMANGIKPQAVNLQFDGKKFPVLPSADPKVEPEWMAIPTGVMDLYYGNWNILHGGTDREKSQEMENLAIRRRHDPAIRRDAQGRNTNKYGFLEFRREVIQPMAMAVDAEHIYSDNYIEI